MPEVNDILAELGEDMNEGGEVETEDEDVNIETFAVNNFNVQMTEIDSIVFDPQNREATDEAVSEISESIKQNGLIVPIIIDGENNLVDGERRLRACKKLGVASVPAIIRNEKTDAGSVLSNLQRENFSKEYLQKRFKKELKKSGVTQTTLAEKYGMTQGRVSQIVGKRKEATRKKQKEKKKTTAVLGVQGKAVFEVAKNINLVIGKKEVKVVFELSNKDLEQPKTALRKLVTETDFGAVERIRNEATDLK